jgi:hypothetical protein
MGEMSAELREKLQMRIGLDAWAIYRWSIWIGSLSRRGQRHLVVIYLVSGRIRASASVTVV